VRSGGQALVRELGSGRGGKSDEGKKRKVTMLPLSLPPFSKP
jgi:hypothetical protein